MNDPWVELLLVSAAAGPLAVYFIWLGVINCGRRPRMLHGSSDLAALALGFAGPVAVGPGLALIRAGAPLPWLITLAALGAAWAAFVAVGQSRGYVIYNIDAARFWQALEAALADLGHTHVRRSSRVALTDVDIELRVDVFAPLRNVAVNVSHSGADRELVELADRLHARLAEVRTGPTVNGGVFLAIGSAALLFPVYTSVAALLATA